MIRTAPIPIGFLTGKTHFVLGRRVSGLLAEPFDKQVLRKRVLRKQSGGKTAIMAYYIDTRGLASQLDQIVGPPNWQSAIEKVEDCGDRILVTASLTIGGITRQAEGEEMKTSLGYLSADDKKAGKEAPVKVEELVFMKAGPQARKRAASEFGVGAYLYDLKDISEELNDRGYPKTHDIDMMALPEWARPTPGSIIVAREAAYLLGIQLPEDLKQTPKEDTERIRLFLSDKFGVKTLSQGYARADYIELAAVIARISDFIDVNGGDVDTLMTLAKVNMITEAALPTSVVPA